MSLVWEVLRRFSVGQALPYFTGGQSTSDEHVTRLHITMAMRDPAVFGPSSAQFQPGLRSNRDMKEKSVRLCHAPVQCARRVGPETPATHVHSRSHPYPPRLWQLSFAEKMPTRRCPARQFSLDTVEGFLQVHMWAHLGLTGPL